MKKLIVSCVILGGMVMNIACAQEIKPAITLNGQVLMEKTICFQLSPQETKFDFRIPEDAHYVYFKINWTGGAPKLHVALLTNELRRPKAQWEGNSPLEREFKLDGEINGEWYLKITNPSASQTAFGCCTFYYASKAELKRDFSFDGANIDLDTNKITYAEFIGFDKSTWGTGTFQITPDGEMGISYKNGNYLKYLGDKGMLIKRGDSISVVERPPYWGGGLDPQVLLNQVQSGDKPPNPKKFASEENQDWYSTLYLWTYSLNEKLSNLPPFLFMVFGIEGENSYKSTLKNYQKNKNVFLTHDFLVTSIYFMLMGAEEGYKKNNTKNVKDEKKE